VEYRLPEQGKVEGAWQMEKVGVKGLDEAGDSLLPGHCQVWELQQNSNAISKTNQNFNENWEQLGYLSQNGNQKKGQNTIQERLKYLWLVIIDYAKTCTPEHEQQIIVAFRDTYFKRLLQGIESAIESRYTPETVKIGLTNTKAFLEFVCFASFNGKGAIKDSSSNNVLERKGSIFFIEDDED